jgi:hypothetical protein
VRGWTGLVLLGAAAACGAEGGRGGAPAEAAAWPADTGVAAVSAELGGAGAMVGTAGTVIEAAPAPPAPPRTELMDTVARLTSATTPERVQLYVDAERDARGRLMWDDGQRWLLQVRRGDAVYPLFDDYVQLGTLRFWTVEPNAGGAAELVLLKETGAGIQLTTYRWDAAREGFVREERYEASGNVVLASPAVR